MKKLIDDLSLEMLIPLIGNIIFFLVLQKNIESFKICIEFFVIVVALVIGIISMVRVKNVADLFYFNLGFSFILIGLLSFLGILISRVFSDKNICVDIINLLVHYEISVYYIMAFFISKRTKSVSTTFLIYLLVTEVMLVSNFNILLLWNKVLYVRLLFIILMAAISFMLIDFRIENNKEKVLHKLFVSTNFIYEFLTLFSGCKLQQCGVLSFIILYINYFIIIKIMSEFSFLRYYKKEEKLLIQAKHSQKNLNRILVNKNKELLDLNISIEKSEIKKKKIINVVKGAILMMSFNKITYANKTVLEFALKHEWGDIIGKDITYIRDKLYKICENTKDYRIKPTINILDLVNDVKQEKSFYNVGLMSSKSREFEIYYVKLNSFDSVIYLKDVTFINKSHKVRSEYYNYLKEDKLKDEFYSNISHELRTPINIIYSAIQLNEVYLEQSKNNNINENTIKIRQNCMRLIRTINNFIDTNKVTEGFLKPNLKIYNIVSVVENIAMSSNRYIEKINNKLVFDPIEEEIYSYFDKDMLERVILNLLSNTVKYGKSGGTVYVNINLVNDNIVIVVRNNLYTLDEEIIPFLFDKFSKLNKSFNREKEGCGLGLFLSKALLELQGGSIKVQTDKESGTKFILTIPRCTRCNYTQEEGDYNLEDLNNRVDIEFSDIYL